MQNKQLTYYRTLLVAAGFLMAVSAFAQKSSRRYTESDILAESQFIEADALFLQGKYKDALIKFKEFIKEFPDIAIAHFQLGRTYEVLDETNKSLVEIQKAVDLEPNRWFLIKQAAILEANGQADKAAEVMLQLIKLEPASAFAYKKAAFYYLLSQMPNEAIDILSKGEKRIGFNPEFCQRKHVIYLAQGNTSKAINELQKILKYTPKSTRVRIQLAEIYLSTGKPKLAEEQYRKILEFDPFNPVALVGLQKRDIAVGDNDVDALMKMIQNPNISIDLKITEIVPIITKASPNSPADKKKQWTQMMMTLLLVHPNNPKASSVTGDMFSAIGEYDKAIAAYQETLKKEKSVYAVWQQTLELLFLKKKYSEVVTTAQDAMNYFPNKSRVMLYLAEAKFRTGHAKKALIDYQQASFMSGRNQHQKRFIYGRLAEIYLAAKDFKNAHKYLDKALKIDDGKDAYIKHVEQEINQKKPIRYNGDWIKHYPFGIFLI